MSRAFLVVVSGLPGTGKSTLAIPLAERIEGVALSRDAARQQIGGRPMLTPASTRLRGRHRRGLQEEATQRLETLVAHQLDANRPVVVELVADRDTRHRLFALAARHGARVCSIEVVCSDAQELARRLGTRRGNWRRVVAQMSKSYEPARGALVVDSRNPREAMLGQAVAFIRRSTG
jgi:predicted kinase